MKKSNKDTVYTEAQISVIEGKTAIEEAHGLLLRNMQEKALSLHDTEVLTLLEKEFKRRQEVKPPGPTPYTEKQMRILNGEIPLESVDSRALPWFYKKALANHDVDLAQTIKERIDILKEEAYKRKIERVVIRERKVRNGELIQWKQPKSNEYTEHQKRIVRNEIPLDKVHSNELISICQKAQNVGDFELSERMMDIVYERRAASLEKRWQREKHKSNLTDFESDNDLGLTVAEYALLQGENHWDEYTEEEIVVIIDKPENISAEFELSIVKEILRYKQNPEKGSIVTNYDDAIDLLEELLKVSIRKPDTWFIKE